MRQTNEVVHNLARIALCHAIFVSSFEFHLISTLILNKKH